MEGLPDEEIITDFRRLEKPSKIDKMINKISINNRESGEPAAAWGERDHHPNKTA
jgi:hypothetical protein